MLILATRVPVRSGDGTPSFVLDNAVALADRFDITILAPRVAGSRPVDVVGGVTVRRFGYFPARWERLADDAIMPQLARRPTLWLQAIALSVRMLQTAAHLHRSVAFDAIHAQWILPSGLVARMLRARFGIRYVVTAHGADATRLNHGPTRALNRWILNGAERFVGVSRDVVDQFEGLRIPISIQPTGVDFDYWSTATGVRRPVVGRVLFVGRLTPKKGAADAIRAIEEAEGCELRLVGDGPLRQELERLVDQKDLRAVVTFLGERPRHEIAKEMRTAMCIVLPSVTAPDGDRDGTPNVLGEAIASGVPIIASRIGGIADSLEDGVTGLLHEPGDVAGLAAHMRRLLLDPEAGARLSASALERTRDHLDIRQVADRYEDWYREAIGSGDGHE